jgi:hypothetical protein
LREGECVNPRESREEYEELFRDRFPSNVDETKKPGIDEMPGSSSNGKLCRSVD